MAVKNNQVYSEIAGKKRYLRVDEVIEDEAICTAGWRARGNQIVWTNRMPAVPTSVLEDTTLYRLEHDE